MLDTRTIELALPAGLKLEGLDIDSLAPDDMRAILHAVFGCEAEDRLDADVLLDQLQDGGWTVRQGLTWVACAERGDHAERVSAPTRCEAVARLREYTLLHDSEGTP